MLINLSGLIFEVNPRFKVCEERFSEFAVTEGKPLETVVVNDEDMKSAMEYGTQESGEDYAELMAFCRLFSNILLKYDRCLFHGAALNLDGHACLFCGPSGIGKSTQIVLWRLLYPDEAQVINGDKPILQFIPETGLETADGENACKAVIVHPSPWRGKENCGYAPAAPLKKIILLRQAKENRIYPADKKDAVLSLYYQFICGDNSEEQVHDMTRMLEKILGAASVWRLENKGNRDSARLCHETLAGRK